MELKAIIDILFLIIVGFMVYVGISYFIRAWFTDKFCVVCGKLKSKDKRTYDEPYCSKECWKDD
jgi:hypothetical protein